MDEVLYDVDNGVATLTLNRPAQRNAIDAAMREALLQRIDALRSDATVRAVVLTGAGGAFCAGGDLRGIAAAQLDAAGWRARLHDAQATVRALLALEQPVIAAIDGPAFGAGFSLALTADIVIASTNARFCLSFMRLGLVPDLGAFYTLPRVVGVQRAKELMLSAREVAADEALRLGIAMELAAPEHVLARAQTIARSFAGASPLAAGLVKRALGAAPGASLDTMLGIEADAQALCFGSAAHRAAIQRFLDKQPATFSWPQGNDT
jgi:2-(1,2-epoxy-1,2-dihydrophenyl)acetyl-CoA isomerase